MSTILLAILSYVGPKVLAIVVNDFLLPLLARGASKAGGEAARRLADVVARHESTLTDEEKEIVARDRATIFEHFRPG